MRISSCIPLAISAFFLVACQPENTDQEGHEFKTTTIGSQVWMAENLNVAHFQNGDPIPHVKNAEEWVQAGEAGQPAWCYFNNDPANGKQFGRLYNWYATVDERGLAPEGWHVPSDEEWTTLSESIGGMADAGTKLKSRTGWSQGNGTDDFGFNGLPAAGRSGVNGFTGQGTVAVFWSTTSKSRSFAWYRVLHARRTGIFKENDDKMSGFSIRCLKNAQ